MNICACSNVKTTFSRSAAVMPLSNVRWLLTGHSGLTSVSSSTLSGLSAFTSEMRHRAFLLTLPVAGHLVSHTWQSMAMAAGLEEHQGPKGREEVSIQSLELEMPAENSHCW